MRVFEILGPFKFMKWDLRKHLHDSKGSKNLEEVFRNH